MTTKLIQKHLLKGTSQFEIVDDYIEVFIKPPFGDEQQQRVMLTVLDPEPVITKSTLNFNSRVNGCTLLSLYLGKPNTEAFNAFVAEVKQRALEEFSAFAGLTPPAQEGATALGANSYEEPPEFDESDEERLARGAKPIDIGGIEGAIEMLNANLGADQVKPLVVALEALKAEPTSQARLVEVLHAFNETGSSQGAILTYAPYVGYLLSDDPFEE